jgi:hypothetical protein
VGEGNHDHAVEPRNQLGDAAAVAAAGALDQQPAIIDAEPEADARGAGPATVAMFNPPKECPECYDDLVYTEAGAEEKPALVPRLITCCNQVVCTGDLVGSVDEMGLLVCPCCLVEHLMEGATVTAKFKVVVRQPAAAAPLEGQQEQEQQEPALAGLEEEGDEQQQQQQQHSQTPPAPVEPVTVAATAPASASALVAQVGGEEEEEGQQQQREAAAALPWQPLSPSGTPPPHLAITIDIVAPGQEEEEEEEEEEAEAAEVDGGVQGDGAAVAGTSVPPPAGEGQELEGRLALPSPVYRDSMAAFIPHNHHPHVQQYAQHEWPEGYVSPTSSEGAPDNYSVASSKCVCACMRLSCLPACLPD